MAILINGNGNLAIYAQQDADWYAALMGGQTVITAVGNQFAYELLDANTIGVKDGVIITSEGRRIQLDANAIDSFDIPTGAQGTTNYYIIGYHLVTGDQSEQTCETFVQLMENGTDTIPEGSFRDGDDEVFVSLYRVEQDDLTIGTITLLLPQLSGSFQSQISELNNDLTEEIVATISANSTQTVTYDWTQKEKITFVLMKSKTVVQSKTVATSIFSTLGPSVSIPLGDTAPIKLSVPKTPMGTGHTGVLQAGDYAGVYRENSDSKPYDATTGNLLNTNSSYGLAADLSNAIEATITQLSNGFTVTNNTDDCNVIIIA